MMENVNMMITPVIRSEVTPQLYYIGFIPGYSMLVGSALAGAVYSVTAMLFKELIKLFKIQNSRFKLR